MKQGGEDDDFMYGGNGTSLCLSLCLRIRLTVLCNSVFAFFSSSWPQGLIFSSVI